MDTMARERGDEHRETLADAIERRAQQVVDEWLVHVRRDASASRVSLTDLQDGIMDYLKRLSSLLRGPGSLDSVGASAWSDVAREHALNRVRLGFDVTQLVHELTVLRRVTTKNLRDEGVLEADQLEILVGLIDAAMAASIQSYIDSRDYSARRMEAEHIGFLSHELKTPLTSVLMATEEICRNLSSPEERRLCEMVDRNLDRIRRTIDDALFTERLHAGEVESHPADLTLEDLVVDSLATFKHKAQAKGLQLIVHFDPDVRLRADPSLTLSAIENLVDNAIKYTDHGKVQLDIEELASEVVFHVRDECGGLSPEELRVIFEPFKRVHTRKPGSGLGLAITRRAVEVQGGTIHAESSAETGCHFWFALPKAHH